MTFAAYQTLYNGSIIFGVKKSLLSENGREDLEENIERLKNKKIYFSNMKTILENELRSIN